jgi:hypothetical protein
LEYSQSVIFITDLIPMRDITIRHFHPVMAQPVRDFLSGFPVALLVFQKLLMQILSVVCPQAVHSADGDSQRPAPHTNLVIGIFQMGLDRAG